MHWLWREKSSKYYRHLNCPMNITPCGYVTASIGVVSMVPDKALTSDVLVKAADEALFKTKERGLTTRVLHDQSGNILVAVIHKWRLSGSIVSKLSDRFGSVGHSDERLLSGIGIQ